MNEVDQEIYLKKLPYRPGVGIMIINDKFEVFVGKRIDSKTEAWQMPQGGIDDGEVPRGAVLREMKEEIGTDNAEILAETKQWYHYDLPFYLISKLWNGRYRGQRQKWFLLKYLGKDKDIKIDNEHPEFASWKWVKMEELPQIIVPFKKKLYISVIEEFRDTIISLKES
ncbi:MAG: RNA pyrophosphohydrolase [Rickettsiales bacterium]|jgi:putative (di)nucleoside polyphosphate hydrolase|nr:RNA pyrophosphohydrolase [Rickettsiales bacterium]